MEGAAESALAWLAPPIAPQGGKGLLLQILLIHLEGNDLGLIKDKVLAIQAIKDIKYINTLWPDIIVVCLAMLPQLVWRREADLHSLALDGEKSTESCTKLWRQC